ncbi:ADP compounds hydrolase NudE [Pseudomonadota bacterium]
MRNKPKILDRKPLVDTGLFRVEQLELEFSNGVRRQHQRLISSPQGAVLVVPLLDKETLLLIREYATGTERYELGFAKGRIEEGEDAIEAARREIQEEVGYAARQLELIASMTIAPGYLSHTTHIVLASDLYPQRLEGDEPEEIEVIPWKLSRLDQLLAQEDFSEARSIAAFYMVRDRLLS